MRKFSTFAFLSLLALASARAEPVIGAGVGGSYTMDDQQARKRIGYEIGQTGVPVTAEAGWRFPLGTRPTAPSLTAGFRAGMQDVESIQPPSTEGVYTSIRIGTAGLEAFARFSAGYFFADLSGGMHRSDVDYHTEMSDLSGKRNDLCCGLSAGGRMELFGQAELRAGPALRYFRIGSFGESGPVNLVTVGAQAGISWFF